MRYLYLILQLAYDCWYARCRSPEAKPGALAVELLELPLVSLVQHARALGTLRYELSALRLHLWTKGLVLHILKLIWMRSKTLKLFIL